MSLSEKFDYVLHYMKKIAGGGYVGFNNAVFLSGKPFYFRMKYLSNNSIKLKQIHFFRA